MMSHLDATTCADKNINSTFCELSGERVLGLQGIDSQTDRQTGIGKQSARRRVANRDDERFLRQEKLIRRGLEQALAQRRIGLKATELCRDAKIANPTFYLHYKNCDDALIQYELALEEAFVKILPRNPRKDLSFTLLLNYILQNRHYFSSTFQNRNLYLLSRLIRYAITPKAGLNQKAYALYLWSVKTMIWCWGEHDGFSEAKLDLYLKKLSMLRVMDYGL